MTTPSLDILGIGNAIVDVLVCLRCFVSMHYNIVISEAEFAMMIDLVMIEG